MSARTAPETVFVTGATGHLGSAIARAFRRSGRRVLGLTRDAHKAEALARDEILPVVGRLQEPATWTAQAAQSDILVHAAVDYTTDSMALDRKVTGQLIQLAQRRGATLLYTSGSWVHGDTGGRVADEDTRLAPATVVAARPATERLVLDASGVHGIVLRPGVVYGGRGGLTAGWFRGDGVIGDGDNRWAMVHVEDLADAYLRAALRAPAAAVYLLTDGQEPRVGQLADAARRSAGLPGTAPRTPLSVARATLGDFADALTLDQRLTSARAARELEWQPRHRGFLADTDLLFGSALSAA